MSVYLCQKCDTWHSTKVQWKKHKCVGKAKANPAYFEKPKESGDIKGMVNSVPKDASEETIISLGRPELIAELKEKELIKDARAVKGKSDDELADMLKTNEG